MNRKKDVFGKYSFKPKIKYFEIRTISEKMNPTKKIFGRQAFNYMEIKAVLLRNRNDHANYVFLESFGEIPQQKIE